MAKEIQKALLNTEMKNGQLGRLLLDGQFKEYGHLAVMVQI